MADDDLIEAQFIEDEPILNYEPARQGLDGIISMPGKGKHISTEVDTYTGEKYELYDQGDGTILRKNLFDSREQLGYAKEARNHAGAGGTEVLKHYAILTPEVQHAMRNAGIDVARDTRAVFKYINEHAPDLKVTNKWHDSEKAKKNNPKIIVK